MAWIRKTAEPVERRPSDIAVLVLATGAFLVTGLFSQSQTSIDAGFFETLNGATDELAGVAKAFFALGSLWAALVVVVVLVAFRLVAVAWRVVIGAVIAWGVADLLNELLPGHAIAGVHVDVRLGDGPVFPSANVAVATAVLVVLAPYAVRPLRRGLLLLLVVVGLASVYLGTAYPSDALGGFLLGVSAGAFALVVLGSPAGRLTADEIRDALGDLGYDVAAIRYSAQPIARASVVDVELATGERRRVEAFGRDERDGQLASKLWRAVAYREPGRPVFGSRVQQVEHIGYILMLADRAKVHAPRLVRTGVGGPDAAVLVTEAPTGSPLSTLVPEQVDDATLDAIWAQIAQLHAAGISHGNLDASRVVVGHDGTVGLDDFSAADATAVSFWQRRDRAAVLVDTALIVGDDRAVAAAVKALDKVGIQDLLPAVEPATMPDATKRGVKHFGKRLKELRSDLATAAGVDEVAPLKVKRLTWVNIGMTAGIVFAFALVVASLQGVNWASIRSEFEDAIWGWAVLAAVLWPLVPTAWATALTGAVNEDLPLGPTVLTQLACSFLNLITPNGIGGTALQVDYLHKEGVPVASAGSAMVLSTGVGSVLQGALFLVVVAITATSFDAHFSMPSASQVMLTIAIVGVLVGLVLWIPKVRSTVVPQVKRAAADILAVVRNPHKALRLLSGNLAGVLLYPLLLGICLAAFHEHLDFAQLMVVQVGAGILGGVAPVPGGIGVQEAALTAGLTSFGIPTNAALATVIVFRTITFGIPPIFGYFTLRWLRVNGYA